MVFNSWRKKTFYKKEKLLGQMLDAKMAELKIAQAQGRDNWAYQQEVGAEVFALKQEYESAQDKVITFEAREISDNITGRALNAVVDSKINGIFR